MQLEVEQLTGAYRRAVDAVEVQRKPYANGFRWTITMHEPRGNIGLLQVDGSTLLGRGGKVEARGVQDGDADLVPGSFTREVQAIVVDSVGPLNETSAFVVEFEGHITQPLPYDVSARELRSALQRLPSIHATSVTRQAIQTGPRDGYEWKVEFAHTSHETVRGAGNLGIMGVDASGCIGMNVRGFASELVRGTNPLRVVVNQLESGKEYSTRVTAFNSRGASIGAQSSARVLVSTQPGPVLSPQLTVASAAQLQVQFSTASDNGGSAIESYRIERFSSEPVHEVQVITVSAASRTIGTARPSGVEEVQVVSTTADLNDIQGSFRVQFGSEVSEDIPHDATASQLEAILERTGSVRNVEVVRTPSWKRLPGLYRARQEVDPTNGTGFVHVTRLDSTVDTIALQPGVTAVRLLTAFDHADSETANTFIVTSDASRAPGSAGAGGADSFVLSKATDPYAALQPDSWNGPAQGDCSVWVAGHGYNWRITFIETAHVGDVPEMVALPGTSWSGTNVVASVVTERQG